MTGRPPPPHIVTDWGLSAFNRAAGSGVGLRPALDAALLGGRLVGSGDDLDQLHRAAGALDRLAGAGGNAGASHRELGLELALAEQPNAVPAAAGETRLPERFMIDHTLGVELAGVDRLLDRADIH